MGRLFVNCFLSLDGVMQSPGQPEEDPSGGFQHGGWLVPFFDETFGRINSELSSNTSGLLLGRLTYDNLAAHWPKITDPANSIAAALNSVPKYVVSKTLDSVEWNNSRLITGDLVSEINVLKNGTDGEIQTIGSGELAQFLMQHDLVDGYRLFTFPVILGSGKRLFERGSTPLRFKLVDSKTSESGIAINFYEREGELNYGTTALNQ